MVENSVVYKAIESYRMHLEMGATPFERSDLDELYICKDYHENGGEETDNWLFSNRVISKAIAYYHKQLDAALERAKDDNDDALINDLRTEQRMTSNLHTRFKKFYSQFNLT